MNKRDKILNRISSVIAQKYPDAEIYLYGSRQDLINYRLERAKDTLDDAKMSFHILNQSNDL